MTKIKIYTFLCLLSCLLTVRAAALADTAFPSSLAGTVSGAGETRTRTAEIGTPAAPTAPYTGRASADGDAAFYALGRRRAPEVERYASVSAGKHLQGFDRKLYDTLKEDIIKVAAGSRESTIFRLTPDDLGLSGRSWTAAELGVTIQKDASGQLTDATWDAVWEPLYRAIGHDRQKSSSAIMDKLLVDCPFELYWFAKSYEGENNAAAHWTYHWSVKYSENKGFTFSNDAYLDVEMMVAENYAKSADGDSYYNYKIDTSLAKQAASIAANARKIVDANKNRSDFEKLTAYRDAICDAVSYDYAAAQQGSGSYGNGPWQLIRVFDGDASTNVVCEGYAKAFQYLCDLSTFSGDVCSYIITGDLVDRNGKPGPHMWNHVRVNGRYWLVDLTNCDVEGVSRDWLFFKAPYAQTVQAGKRSYAFARNGEVALRYTNIENAYEAEEVLILTEVDYSSLDSNAAAVSDSGDTPAPDSGNTPARDSGNTPAPDSGNTPTHDGGSTPAPDDTEPPAPVPDDNGGGVSPENADWSMTYPVMVTAGSSNFTEAPAGVPVSVTADPAPAGQRFRTWGGGAGLTFTRGSVSSASATFLMPSGPLYLSALYEEARFDDVEPGAYYDQPVLWAIARGITNGVSPTNFAPHDTCTRAQILTFLYRAAGEPPIRSGNPFPDVSPEVYYYRPAVWAAERGLVDGQYFEPDTPCTRAAVMVYFWKLAGAPTGNRNPFEDVPDWMDYAEAIAWGVSRGITAGTTPTTFEPERTCTRAQIVTFLYRHLVETGGSLNAAGWQEPEPEAVPAPDSGDSAGMETL